MACNYPKYCMPCIFIVVKKHTKVTILTIFNCTDQQCYVNIHSLKQISRAFPSCKSESSYNFSFLLSPTPGNSHSSFCSYETDYLLSHIGKII